MSLFLHDSCTILHILQEMVQDFARVAARIITCISCTFFARSCKNLCKIVQENGHITCTCQASLACKILARVLHNLASSFLLGGTDRGVCQILSVQLGILFGGLLQHCWSLAVVFLELFLVK